ncbi:hypothetical protein WMY93_028340 [Mugilogobius chulae]|uniref:Protein kinase domain-containing protein n=1 Tax=Mugilogobius chulae TaxID=88201 RepID=A0AAW0MUB3_9GOBI
MDDGSEAEPMDDPPVPPPSPTGTGEYALKIISKDKCRGKEHLVQNEVAILRRVKHPNIVLLIEEMDTPTELYLVMELVKGGDLFDAITSSDKYTERDASSMLFNLASAIKYLHSHSIVHRDIKPENLLVYEHQDGTMSLKLGDFGLATVVNGSLFAVCGTPTYVARRSCGDRVRSTHTLGALLVKTDSHTLYPITLQVLPNLSFGVHFLYGVKVDVWAAGVITYILLCGFPPFRGSGPEHEELFQHILIGTLSSPHHTGTESLLLPRSDPHWTCDLIRGMLQLEVEQRLSAEQVLEQPWVKEEGLTQSEQHLCVATRIKKNFNTTARVINSSAGVSVITVQLYVDRIGKAAQVRKQALWTAAVPQDCSGQGTTAPPAVLLSLHRPVSVCASSAPSCQRLCFLCTVLSVSVLFCIVLSASVLPLHRPVSVCASDAPSCQRLCLFCTVLSVSVLPPAPSSSVLPLMHCPVSVCASLHRPVSVCASSAPSCQCLCLLCTVLSVSVPSSVSGTVLSGRSVPSLCTVLSVSVPLPVCTVLSVSVPPLHRPVSVCASSAPSCQVCAFCTSVRSVLLCTSVRSVPPLHRPVSVCALLHRPVSVCALLHRPVSVWPPLHRPVSVCASSAPSRQRLFLSCA